MARIEQKNAYTVADVVKHTWFMRYLWPMTVIVDRGTEFLAKFAEMIQKISVQQKSYHYQKCESKLNF